jgi:hypothetical protein
MKRMRPLHREMVKGDIGFIAIMFFSAGFALAKFGSGDWTSYAVPPFILLVTLFVFFATMRRYDG